MFHVSVNVRHIQYRGTKCYSIVTNLLHVPNLGNLLAVLCHGSIQWSVKIYQTCGVCTGVCISWFSYANICPCRMLVHVHGQYWILEIRIWNHISHVWHQLHIYKYGKYPTCAYNNCSCWLGTCGDSIYS